MEAKRGARIPSIDFVRTIAVFAVILIHTYPFGGIESGLGKYLKVFINQGARFAVPFFFIISGFFWGRKIEAGLNSVHVFYRYGGRTVSVFIAWSIIYLVVPNNIAVLSANGLIGLLQVPYSRLVSLMGDPLKLLFQGTKDHLWFLVSLLWALLLSSAMVKLNRGIWLIPLASMLYLFGVLAGSYSETPIGIPIEFNTRNGPFFSTLFFAIGWLFSRDRRLFSMKLAIALFLGGLVLHMGEAYFLLRLFEVNPMRHDFLFGTVAYGMGAAAIVFSVPALGENTFVTKWGPYTLGIYVIHFLYVDLLGSLGSLFNLYIWGIVFPLIVFLLSLATAMFIAKFYLLRKIVI